MQQKPMKTPRPRLPETSKILIVLASLIIVLAGLKAASGFFMPILLAFFLSTISFPIMNWFRNHRVPRLLSVLTTVLVNFAFLAGIILIAITLVSELQNKWESKYYSLTQRRVTEFVENVSTGVDGWNSLQTRVTRFLKITETQKKTLTNPKTLPVTPSFLDTPEENTLSSIESISQELLESFSVKSAFTLGTDILSKIISFLGATFIILVLSVFMLSEARIFGRRFVAIAEAKGPNLQRMLSAVKDIQRYLGIKTLVSLLTGILAGLLCYAINLEFPLLWGIIAFVLNYIPVIGSMVAGIPPVLLSLLVFGDWKHAAVITGGYFVINALLGNFLEPFLLGRRLGVSTLILIISVIFWGWLWGPLGMLLAVPMTMLIKVVLENSTEFRWIAVAMNQNDRKSCPQQEEDSMKEAMKEAVAAKPQIIIQEDEESSDSK